MITLIEDLKKLAKHKSSIKPPSLISSPFQRRKVINPTPSPPPPRRLRHGSTVSYSGTNSDGATYTFNFRKQIMRLEIDLLVFNRQKNYQS